jgi:nucleoside 2-deoxyribosyltransferase
MHVFLSYSRNDSEFALKLAADLKSLGIDPWVDVADLLPGQDWRLEIEKAIQSADFMLVLVSSHSAVSDWVMKETEAALRGAQRVIPVIVDAESKLTIPVRLRALQWVDLSDPNTYESRLRTFAAELLRIASVQETPKPIVDDKARQQFAGIDIEELASRIAKDVIERMGLTVSQQASAVNSTRSETRDAESKSVFVVMAFTDDMEPVFEGIRDAANAAGLEAQRVKDVVGDYQISNKLIKMINDASMVVVDLTHERPNVYFELGYARGTGKTVITTARSGTNLHFDVRDWTCTFYSDSRVLERALKERFVIELQNLRQKGGGVRAS